MGAQLVKEVATKTNDIAGDGTTTATVLAQALGIAKACATLPPAPTRWASSEGIEKPPLKPRSSSIAKQSEGERGKERSPRSPPSPPPTQHR